MSDTKSKKLGNMTRKVMRSPSNLHLSFVYEGVTFTLHKGREAERPYGLTLELYISDRKRRHADPKFTWVIARAPLGPSPEEVRARCRDLLVEATLAL